MDLVRALTTSAADRRLFRTAVVTAVGTQAVTLNVDGASLTLPALTTPSGYAIGDSVLVARDGASGGWVLGKIGSTVTAPAAPVTPTQPSVSLRERTVLPYFTGTYRGGKWRDTSDLYQGDYGGFGLNTGAAYYGTQIYALGAVTASPHSAYLTYRRQSGGTYAAQIPTMRLLAAGTKPAGAPVLGTSSAGTAVAVGNVATWELPGAWVTALLNGTAGGIAINSASSTPYIVLDGLADYAAAMALTFSYYA